MWWWLAVPVLLWLVLGRDPPAIFGKYRQPGPRFWIKYVVFRIIMWLRRQQTQLAVDENGRPVHCLAGKERALPLSTHPLAFDAVFFIATNQQGFYFAAGSERRHHNIVNGLVYLMVPGIGLLRSSRLPDTILFGAKDGFFGAEGLSLQPVEPLKKWKVDFEGTMHLKDDPSQQFEVSLHGLWTSDNPVFNFDTDLHPHVLAKTIATEQWSREYFDALKRAHQTHYEQMGHLRCTLKLNAGKREDTHELQLMSMRDHSIGEARDWDLMHRYAFFFFFLEDGTMGSVGIINQPCTCSTMQSGYVVTPDGKVHPLEWCDMLLYQHGEDGTPPTDHAFSFKAGGQMYRVKVKVEDLGIHYVGWRWEARMVERFVSYDVNGIKGRGVSEFHYHHAGGRAPTPGDPHWFKDVLRDTYNNKSKLTVFAPQPQGSTSPSENNMVKCA